MRIVHHVFLRKKRDYIAIALLLCLVAPIGVTYVALKVRKEQVREEVKATILAGVDRGELVLHKFLKSEVDDLVDWEHDREFKYQGQSYDVVEVEDHGDSVHYYTWWDKVETKLDNQLDELVANAMADDPERESNREELVQLFKSLYFSSTRVAEAYGDVLNNEWRPSQTAFFDSRIIAPPVPPPLV